MKKLHSRMNSVAHYTTITTTTKNPTVVILYYITAQDNIQYINQYSTYVGGSQLQFSQTPFEEIKVLE